MARSLLSDVITAMKIWPFDRFSEGSIGQYTSPAQVEQGLQPVRQIREAVGAAIEIGIECHFRWNRPSMERIVRALEPYDILFLEDPLPAVYPDEIRLLGKRTTIRIVGSELLLTRWQLREWMEKHVASILMTDPLWNGGVGETRKIAAMAEALGLPLVLHNLAGPIGHAVNMHLGAHIPNPFFVEYPRALYRSYFATLSDLAPIPVDGCFAAPDGPGLGVNLNPSALERGDLTRELTSGPGLAEGRRAMGDHWAVEAIR